MSTTEITTTPVITLTEKATAKVAELLAQEGDDQMALRVAVKAGGCSGMSYEIFFDAETGPDDHLAMFGTVKVRVDAASAAHIAGCDPRIQRRPPGRRVPHREPQRPAFLRLRFVLFVAAPNDEPIGHVGPARPRPAHLGHRSVQLPVHVLHA